MGNQDWRHYLNGLYLSINNGEITAVTTDAHRLAVASIDTNSQHSFQESFLENLLMKWGNF